ncbi:thioredoxin domain-containing protein [Arthrobacter cryoconiti]|uniref:Thioredoxin domain-containing protein n=1 Tax=Arthrobacter cryoconiti TaxID=748907 RepID=A0ABV8R423_9MICC|nr:thioredoxin domain-containing protein [Arthrobacter cryoconiti]MCC9066955.1 thioredoxin domain-containing protein [Arthrobacter cryoconiti]
MNRLASEPSAYLRQHASNPVDWHPFGAAAFAQARERNVPVFLSIGYAACHWCHVMARESFEDPQVGAYLREHFVSIKVDREERPDVDDAYMAATQALTGQGGWPMSVFLTPSGQAFYAGTYFPPQASPARPSFRQVLAAVTEAWTERPEEVMSTANAVSAALANPVWRVQSGHGLTPKADPVIDFSAGLGAGLASCTSAAVLAMADAEDRLHGGLGTAPKFPPTPALEFLIRHAATQAPTAAVARGLAGRTLGAMVGSALFDQVAGGFARYSVSADWSLPHYEKMLYDNAGLLRALVHWVRLVESSPGSVNVAEEPSSVSSGTSALRATLSVEDARRAAKETIAWLLAELRLPGGGFASSLDADTVIDGVHHEGASYQWTREELISAASDAASDVASDLAALGTDAEQAASAVGDFMHIPAAGAGALHPGRELSRTERAIWKTVLPGLKSLRAKRTMPARDEKVVAAWNGMLLSALAEAAMILEEPQALDAALELAHYLCQVHWDGSVLLRVSHEGLARGIEGMLEDYAACADGFMALYAATGDMAWFDSAGALLESARRFAVEGTLMNTAVVGAGLAQAPAGARFADPFDNATASPVAMLAGALVSHGAYTGAREDRVWVEQLLGSVRELAQRAPRSAGGLLSVVEALLAGPVEVAIVGVPGGACDALVSQAWKSPSPGLVIAVWEGDGEAPVALMEGRGIGSGSNEQPLAYVCYNTACQRPVSTAPELAALLGYDSELTYDPTGPDRGAEDVT